MTIPQPSFDAIMAAAAWARAHGTYVACESRAELLRYAAAWCPRNDVSAFIGENHVAGPSTTHDFMLAPAIDELARPDGGGLTIHIAGIGLLRTLPEQLILGMFEEVEVSGLHLSELTDARLQDGNPDAAARFHIYLEQRTTIRDVAQRARAHGIESPVVMVIDAREEAGRSILGDAKAAAASAEADIPLVINAALLVGALMQPGSPLPTPGREFLTRTAGDGRYFPVVVIAAAGTSYFSIPIEA
jgi:hypothetical protein